MFMRVFFLQAEDGVRDTSVTGVQTCALPIFAASLGSQEFGLGSALIFSMPIRYRHLCSPSIEDRKSTRLNSSHRCISYAVFCLKKKKIGHTNRPHLPARTRTGTHAQSYFRQS